MQPANKDLDFFECRHGLGYTRITGARAGLRAECLFLVPRGIAVEVHQVTLANETDRPKALDLFSLRGMMPLECRRRYDQFQRNLSTGEVEVEGSTIYHKTEYRERRKHYAFMGPVAGFDTDRDSFLGPYRGLYAPQAVEEGRARNSFASGWTPIASHHLQLTLGTGEAKTLIFVLGYAENPPERKWAAKGVINKELALAILSRFTRTEQARAVLDELRSYWDEILSHYVLGAPGPEALSHGQRLEPVPVHGGLQPLAQRFLL